MEKTVQICNLIANLHAFGVFWLEIPCNFAMEQKNAGNVVEAKCAGNGSVRTLTWGCKQGIYPP